VQPNNEIADLKNSSQYFITTVDCSVFPITHGRKEKQVFLLRFTRFLVTLRIGNQFRSMT
jgi:hypothetical protein